MITGNPTFSLRHRMFRAIWQLTWLLFAAWTPPPMHNWRRFLLHIFGATIHPTARVYGSVTVWYPPHLTVGKHVTIGPKVNCYTMAPISLEAYVVVSQGAHLCTGTHDIHHPDFDLITRPICIEKNAWICSEAFVGPGVNVGEGAVLGARGVTFTDLSAWDVYSGNPAKNVKSRTRFERD